MERSSIQDARSLISAFHEKNTSHCHSPPRKKPSKSCIHRAPKANSRTITITMPITIETNSDLYTLIFTPFPFQKFLLSCIYSHNRIILFIAIASFQKVAWEVSFILNVIYLSFFTTTDVQKPCPS